MGAASYLWHWGGEGAEVPSPPADEMGAEVVRGQMRRQELGLESQLHLSLPSACLEGAQARHSPPLSLPLLILITPESLLVGRTQANG